jgi:hypothetical protein
MAQSKIVKMVLEKKAAVAATHKAARPSEVWPLASENSGGPWAARFNDRWT